MSALIPNNPEQKDILDLIDELGKSLDVSKLRRGIQPEKATLEEVLTNKTAIQTAIACLLGSTLDLQKTTQRPEAKHLFSHPIYQQLVLGILDTNGTKERHKLAFTPVDPDGENVLKNIEILSQEMSKIEGISKELTQERIKTLLWINTVLNTRELNQREILSVNLDREGFRRKEFSTKELYTVWSKIKNAGTVGDAASLRLCKELGLLTEMSEGEALKKMKVNKDKAWEYLKEIMNESNKALESENEDDAEVEELEANTNLRPMTLFEWIGVMFDESADPRTRVEAQALLKFTLEFYNIRNNHAYEGSTMLKDLVGKRLETLFERGGEEFRKVYFNKLIFDEKGNIIRVVPNGMKADARKLKLEGFESFSKLVLYKPFDPKGADSTLTKLITREADQNPEDVNDHLRSTLVLPDITSKQLSEDPKAKSYAKEILKASGEKLGLKLVSKKRRDLQVGEFIIEDAYAENPSKLFKNMKLIGKLPADTSENKAETKLKLGTTLEIQLDPIDLHEINSGKNSPYKHEVYSQLRRIKAADYCLPNSYYKEAHRALESKRNKIEASRKTAERSGEDYVRNRTNFTNQKDDQEQPN